MISCVKCGNKTTRNPNRLERAGRSVVSLRLYKWCTFCKAMFKAYDE